MQVSGNLFSSACSVLSGCRAVVVMNKLKSLRSSDEEFASVRIAFVLTWLDVSPLVTLTLEYVILEW